MDTGIINFIQSNEAFYGLQVEDVNIRENFVSAQPTCRLILFVAICSDATISPR